MHNYINETHVYFQTKDLLKKMGWVIIAGEPAGGSDEIPRVEIRDINNMGKGSKGSYKIDLISMKNNLLLLTEVKVRFSLKDVEKLNNISLNRNFLDKALMERLKINTSNKKIVKSLALSNFKIQNIPQDFVCFNITDTPTVINPNLLLED